MSEIFTLKVLVVALPFTSVTVSDTSLSPRSEQSKEVLLSTLEAMVQLSELDTSA